MIAEIDAEIAAAEEAAAAAAEEAALEGTEDEMAAETAGADMPAEEEPAAEEDLGTLADLESFGQSGNEILLEDQELNMDATMLLTEDDLPSPADLDAEKDFSENI
jgi:hypothetical protein